MLKSVLSSLDSSFTSTWDNHLQSLQGIIQSRKVWLDNNSELLVLLLLLQNM